MPIRKPGRCGALNLKTAAWDCGAFLMWKPRFNTVAQFGAGGTMTESDDFVYTYSGAGTSLGDWTHYDSGLGGFTEEPQPTPNVVPVDGHFQPERLNTYVASSDSSSDRGPFTREAGLSLALLTPPPAPHIVTNTTGIPADVPVVTNTSGATKRMYRNETTSNGNKKMWSMLFRQADGSKVDNTVVTLGASADGTPLGADLGEGSTRYVKLREDGWYQAFRSIPDQAGANVNYFADIADGVVNLRYEAPQVETFNTTIAEPTAPILTSTVSRRRHKHLIELEGSYRLQPYGWMGCTVIPFSNAATLVAGPAPGLIQGDILTWRIDANNRCRIIWSATDETIKFIMEQGGSTQADLQIPQAKVLQGVPLGITAAWGSREGSNFVMLAVNGQQEDVVDTTNTPPDGVAEIFIGANDSGGSVANCMIQCAAFGNNDLERGDIIALSRWFETQSYSTLDVEGA